MRKPLKSGTPIDPKRIKRWTDLFGAYRSAVTPNTIEGWLGQFSQPDKDLAARVLDVVEFYGQAQIHAAYRQSLGSLTGWHINKGERAGVWRFAAMSGSAGESADGMLYHFRIANNLDAKRHNELFVARRDLFVQKLGAKDTVVLLDDFSGTGTQVCDAWNDPQTAFGEMLADVGRIFLVLVAATRVAKRKIAHETRLAVLPSHELGPGDNIFSSDCNHFTVADQTRLLHYCKQASNSAPRGWGDSGLVVVFQHRTPNNSIPILHADHERWTGLFPRHD